VHRGKEMQKSPMLSQSTTTALIRGLHRSGYQSHGQEGYEDGQVRRKYQLGIPCVEITQRGVKILA